jgi:TldD protein
MTASSLFLEYKDVLEVSSRQAEPQRHRSTDAGLGLEGTAPPGGVADYRWRSLPPSGCLEALPSELAGAPARQLLEAPALAGSDEERLATLTERLRATMREEGIGSAHVTLREVDRRILWWDADGVRTDRQRYAQVDIRASVDERNPAHATALMRAYADGSDVEASWPALREAVAELARTARLKAHLEPCPRGPLTVVMPPGPPAGVFFHEVCGHPLEGDLVLRQSSYLAQRMGEAVGPEFLSVADVPGDSRGRVAYALDDEGVCSGLDAWPSRCWIGARPPRSACLPMATAGASATGTGRSRA